jgi:hypothetical protein
MARLIRSHLHGTWRRLLELKFAKSFEQSIALVIFKHRVAETE